MDTQTRFLWAFVVALVALGGLFTWSTMYRHSNTFAIGTRPTDVQEQLPPTLPPIRASDPRLGSKQANALEFVEFGDYRCLHCRAMTPDLLAILSDPTRNIRMVWREAPTQDQSRENLLPFVAARCAQAQNKFEEMHPALYQLGTLNEATITEAAKTIKLNMTQFQACLNNVRVLESVQSDQQTAIAAHITAAPTIFIKGQPYIGLLDRSQLESILR
jgi:protein-disulfide isomerase